MALGRCGLLKLVSSKHAFALMTAPSSQTVLSRLYGSTKVLKFTIINIGNWKHKDQALGF